MAGTAHFSSSPGVKGLADGAALTTVFSSVTGNVLATTDQFKSDGVSCEYAAAAIGTFAATASITPITNYKTINVAFWFRPSTISFSSGSQHSLLHVSTWFDIVATYTAGVPKLKARILTAANAVANLTSGGSANAVTADSSTLAVDTWHSVKVVYTNIDATHTMIDLYVNDVLIGGTGSAIRAPLASTQFRVGSSATSPGSGALNASGSLWYIDDVGIASFDGVTVPDRRDGRAFFGRGLMGVYA